LQFFSDYKKHVESRGHTNQLIADSRSIKIKTYFLYTGYSCLGIGLFVFFSLLLFDAVSFEYYVLHSSIVAHLRDLTSLGISTKLFLVTRTLHALPITATLLISDMVPALVYNHVAIHIKSVQAELDSLFRARLCKTSESGWGTIDVNEDEQDLCSIKSVVHVSMTLSSHKSGTKNIASSVKTIFTYYDSIRSMIIRADSVFGFYVLLNHGIHFFTICTLVYTLFYNLKANSQLFDIVFCFPVLAFFLIRFIVSVLLTSAVHWSASQLRSTLAYAQTQLDETLEENERRVIDNFLDRVTNDQMVASPLGLYAITPSLLLKMLNC
jgi:hypothetical protein